MTSIRLSTTIRLLLLLVPATLISIAVSGQAASFPLTAKRWLVSANPLGLMEAPMAIGLGFGYRISAGYELWSETSILKKGLLAADGPVNGFRQSLQFKEFVGQQQHVFLAQELRYKYYAFLDSGEFLNKATSVRLYGVPNFQRHFVYGAGFQLGYRAAIGKSERLRLEFSAGIGIKNKVISRRGVPPGYVYNPITSTDLNIRDEINTSGIAVYCPGSLRLIYTFGKTIR